MPLPTLAQQEAQILSVPPILNRIAFCESGGNQYNPDGSVKISRTHDIGKFQINMATHLKQAEQMGINLYTLEGNTRFALWLYSNQGTNPWYPSKHCWQS